MAMLALFCLIAIMWGVVLYTIKSMVGKTGEVRLENPSIFLMFALLAYGTFPPLMYLLQGGTYLSLKSGRLFEWQPNVDEQIYLVSLALTFLVCFLIGFLSLTTRSLLKRSLVVVMVPQRIFALSVLIVGLDFLTRFVLNYSGAIEVANSYIDSYRVIQEMPLLVKQSIKFLNGIASYASVVILVWLFQRWDSKKHWIFCIVVAQLSMYDMEMGRAGILISALLILMLWNRFVRKLNLKKILLWLVCLVVSFSVIGVHRGLAGSFENFDISEMLFTSLGEFDVLWGNAIELYRERDNGDPIPISLYFSDIYSFVPAFVVPFEKLSYSIWYLDNFYPNLKEAGGGLMFGLLAQLSIGQGILEGIVRGLLFGLGMGWLTNYLMKTKSWWSYPTLVYLSVWIFYTVRNSSFSILDNIFQVVIPTVLLLNFASSLLRRQYLD